MAANFCPMHDVCTTLKSLDGTAVTLMDPAVEARICVELAGGVKYTRLMLSAGVGFEEFEVRCVGGCLKLDGVPTTKFMSGDTIWYESCSKANIADIMACLAEEAAEELAEEEGAGSFKIDGFVRETNDEGEVCWVRDPTLKESATFQVGKQIITIAGDGCPTVRDAPVGTYLTPGEYTNGVTVGDNCLITGVKDIAKPVCNCSGCCGTKKDAEGVVQAGVI